MMDMIEGLELVLGGIGAFFAAGVIFLAKFGKTDTSAKVQKYRDKIKKAEEAINKITSKKK